MQWSDLVLGVGFVLMVEGVPLFLSPGRYRQLLSRIDSISDRALRFFGFSAMCIGLGLLYAVR
ncbi:MAG: DUF2065 domain-containing protein [Leptospirillia bacterium]